MGLLLKLRVAGSQWNFWNLTLVGELYLLEDVKLSNKADKLFL